MTSTVNCQMTQGSQDHCRYQRIGCPGRFLGLPGGVLGGQGTGKSCGEGIVEEPGGPVGPAGPGGCHNRLPTWKIPGP